MYFTDIEQIRTRLAESDLPAPVVQAYLQVLTNLNALSLLMVPEEDEQDSPEETQLTRLFARHQRRRARMEEEYPILGVLSRPTGWQGN